MATPKACIDWSYPFNIQTKDVLEKSQESTRKSIAGKIVRLSNTRLGNALHRIINVIAPNSTLIISGHFKVVINWIL